MTDVVVDPVAVTMGINMAFGVGIGVMGTMFVQWVRGEDAKNAQIDREHAPVLDRVRAMQEAGRVDEPEPDGRPLFGRRGSHRMPVWVSVVAVWGGVRVRTVPPPPLAPGPEPTPNPEPVRRPLHDINDGVKWTNKARVVVPAPRRDEWEAILVRQDLQKDEEHRDLLKGPVENEPTAFMPPVPDPEAVPA